MSLCESRTELEIKDQNMVKHILTEDYTRSEVLMATKKSKTVCGKKLN